MRWPLQVHPTGVDLVEPSLRSSSRSLLGNLRSMELWPTFKHQQPLPSQVTYKVHLKLLLAGVSTGYSPSLQEQRSSKSARHYVALKDMHGKNVQPLSLEQTLGEGGAWAYRCLITYETMCWALLVLPEFLSGGDNKILCSPFRVPCCSARGQMPSYQHPVYIPNCSLSIPSTF